MKYFNLKSNPKNFDENTILSIFDNSLNRLCDLLEVNLKDWITVDVVLWDGPSCLKNEEIYVCNNNPKNTIDINKWIEYVFSHELCHLLVGKYLGSAPVLFWEGIPIYFSDNLLKEKLFKTTYDEYCLFFLKKNNLISIENLVFPNIFYSNRRDPRYDLQSGSIVGFLAKRYGNTAIKSFISEYEQPTPNNPCLKINNLLKKYFYFDNLFMLERSWKEYLEKQIDLKKVIEDKASKFILNKIENPITHCNFCYSPIERDKKVCSVCDANSKVNLTIA